MQGNGQRNRMAQHKVCRVTFTMKLIVLQGHIIWTMHPLAFLLRPLLKTLNSEAHTNLVVKEREL